MSIRKTTLSLLIIGMAAGLAQSAVSSDDGAALGFGAIRGVTQDVSGQPLAMVRISIQRGDGNYDRNVVSDSNGLFAADHLPSGAYWITATKEGQASPTAMTVVITKGQTTHPRVVLAAAKPAPKPTAVPATAPLTIEQELQAMKDRIAALEAELKARPVAAAPAPATPAATPAAGPDSATPPAAAQPEAAPAQPAPAAAPVPAETQPPAQQAVPGTAAAPPTPPVDNVTPFADHDWTWLNGNPRNKDTAFDSKFFTPEIRADVTYTYDFNRPMDDSMGGSSELFRSNEIELEQLGIGGDFHWDNVRARFMTQFGMYSTTTARNDPSPAKGQWDLSDAMRYLSEAYGGYHLDALHGINLDAGIFLSYVGLFSYYNYDNWAYQPSYVSSNTPWFFEGVRIQIFPTQHLKIEPWIINGWQSYGSANSRKGLGGQIKWTPFPWMNVISNNYGLGHDDLYIPNRARIHTDNSVEIKYYDKMGKGLDKMALSFTGDLGCEFGGGVSCHGNTAGGPKQSFVGFMLYNRWWFDRDLFGFTLGGGMINNPGRYLVLLPPINGESAASAALNSPYFTENPGDPFKAWDVSGTFDYMPRQWLTWRFEGDFRHANVPYWSGSDGITPPPGTNNGFPTQYACNNGAASGQLVLSAATASCAGQGGVWFPNLRKREFLIDIDLLIKF